MVEHVDIPDSERHYPRGADSATADQVMVSNGDGTTTWVGVGSVFNPADFTIERVIESESTAGSQLPTGTDSPIQIEFGPAVNGSGDPARLLSDGSVVINQAGLYRVKVHFQLGRTGSTGVSRIHIRALINGTQSGRTISFVLEETESIRDFKEEIWLGLNDGDTITYELVRDSSGADFGGLYLTDPTLSGWNNSPTAALRVERFV